MAKPVLSPLKVLAAIRSRSRRRRLWVKVMLHLVTHLLLGHGAMQFPPTWFDQGGHSAQAPGGFNLGVMWFTNETGIPDGQKHTLPEDMHTYKETGGYPGSGGFKNRTPWLAPGTAKIFSSCGIAGGPPGGAGTLVSTQSITAK